MQQPTSSSQTDASEMHLFDIRRSNSITELWKKFEYPSYVNGAQAAEADDEKVEDARSNHEVEETSNSAPSNVTSCGGDRSQPLLAAFEAEIAKLLNTSESANVQSPQHGRSSSAGAESEPSSSENRPNPADTLTQAINNIVVGAEIVRGEVRSRIPELERRLQDAQRALPEHVGTALQGTITTLESNVRNLAGALNNISLSGAQRSDSSAQAQTSPATNTVDGLRTMASEIGQMGQTLFTAFEHGLGSRQRNAAQAPGDDICNPSNAGSQDEAGNPGVAPPGAAVPSAESTSGLSGNEEVASASRDARNANTNPQTNEAAGERNAASSGGNENRNFMKWQPPSFQAPLFPPAPFAPYPPSLWRLNRLPRPAQPPSHRRGRESSHDLSGSPRHRLASNTLFIGNVGFNVSAGMIQTVFESKGFLVDVDLPVDSQAGKHAGFGYLKFASIHAAKAALEALQGTHIDGHSINLEFSDNSPITALHTSREFQGTTFQAEPNNSRDDSNVKARSSLSGQNRREPFSRQKARCLKEQNNKGKERVSGGNRKPLAFGEPNPSSSRGPSETGLGASEPVSSSHKATSGIGALLDQDNGDPEFSARYPSLLPETSRRQSRFGSTPDPFTHLSPELEMLRFPPVSQLDAHAMATQRGEIQSSSTASARGAERNGQNAEARKATSPPVPGSFPQDTQDLPEREEQPKQGLRRWNTVMPENPSARLTGPFNPHFPVDAGGAARPLRRRATERQSLHNKNFEDRQPGPYWRRQAVKTEESIHMPRHSNRPHHKPPKKPVSMANMQAVQTSRPSDIGHSEDRVRIGSQHVDDCVATLLRLGYGGVRDGGHARIRMYSEVANGKVLEAIEMIEEERKAYEQQRRR